METFTLDSLILSEIGMATHIASEPSIEKHNHPFYEITYVVQGSLNHVLNGFKRTLSMGEGYIFNLNDIHSYSSVNNDRVFIRDILVSKELFETLVAQSPNLRTVKTCTEEKLKFITLNSNEIEQFENLLSQFTQTLDLSIKKLLALQIVSKMYLKLFYNINPIDANDDKPYWLKVILNDLNKNCFVQRGINTIISDVGYSFPYVCTSFKKYMGITMTDYLKEVRLTRASYLLKNTNMSLEEIIESIGITSLSYFNKIFNKKFGTTPAKYRRNNGRKQV